MRHELTAPRPEAKRRALRTLVAAGRATAIPGVYDALGAVLAAEAGFPALHLSGAALSASLGYPDIGLVGLGEIAGAVRRVAAAAPVPLVADGESGFGGAANVWRTVREIEAAGAAAVHIEDVTLYRGAGELATPRLDDRDEAIRRVRAAVAARSDPDFLIVARTDARRTAPLAEAIARCRAFRDAGADVVFPEFLPSLEELRELAAAVPGPKMITLRHGGRIPPPPAAELSALGVVLAVFAVSPVLAAAQAMSGVMAAIWEDFSDRRCADRMLSPAELSARLGLAEATAWDSAR